MKLPRALLLLIVAGCQPSTSAGRCDDGQLCENVDWCSPGGTCKPPGSCAGKADGVECRLDDETGRCSNQECEAIPATCGDDTVDDREQCDGLATSCYDLSFAFGGQAPCRSCLHDTSGCREVGWRPVMATPPGGMVEGGLRVRDGVLWAATDRGVYRWQAGQWVGVETGNYRYLGAAADGTMYALRLDVNDRGTVVRLGDLRQEYPLPTNDAPLAMVVRADGEVIVSAFGGAHHLTSAGWQSRLYGATSFSLYDAGAAVYAIGTLGPRGLWRYAGADWTLIPDTADALAISGTTDALYVSLQSGGIRKLTAQGSTTLPTTARGRFVAFGAGRMLFAETNIATLLDGSDRTATFQVPLSITASSWDPLGRKLWVATADSIFVHEGVDVDRSGDLGVANRLGVSEMMMVDGSLALTIENGANAALWALGSSGLDPAFWGIGFAPIGSGGPIAGSWFQDQNRRYVIRGDEIWSYDTRRGPAPIRQTLPARAIASNGELVMSVGAGAWQLDMSGTMWAAADTGLSGIDLRAIAPFGAGFIAAGATGALYHYTGGRWTAWTTQTSATLSAVHAIGDRVFAAGTGGTILTCSAGACEQAVTNVTADLTDIDGLRIDDMFAVGGGASLHFDGERWNRIDLEIAASRVTVGDGAVWFTGPPDRALYRLLRIVP
ncbi:MAG: hypothetical protein ACKV2T_11585 [Kofleriaceae bacterium]